MERKFASTQEKRANSRSEHRFIKQQALISLLGEKHNIMSFSNETNNAKHSRGNLRVVCNGLRQHSQKYNNI